MMTIGCLQLVGGLLKPNADSKAESSWAKAPSFHDILILKLCVLIIEFNLMGGRPILPPVPPADGLDRVPSNMRSGGIIFFRTQSSRHFEGGDWDQGGTCQRLQPLLPGEIVITAVVVVWCMQIARNITTNELWNRRRFSYLRGADGRFYNPYNHGWRRNCSDFLVNGYTRDDEVVPSSIL
ncbi:hypothetical protein F2Q68_00019166 [Brassica cretica]|uniref:Trichome birefringence-like C-terminal domain-containing protein n=1 Tax=Brassica cretica TaxID=69181 RepID=A0A8S9G5C2_BRACR|nr:hypothetical protein F2Q68_00019166 [Brassica cretica]